MTQIGRRTVKKMRPVRDTKEWRRYKVFSSLMSLEANLACGHYIAFWTEVPMPTHIWQGHLCLKA
jgi:hypothetical protein